MKTLQLKCSLLLAALASAPLCQAVQIRGYTATRHDRFTGFPDSPVFNPNAWFNSSAYTGVGWEANDTQKQFALVTQRHIVTAQHFLPGIGSVIRFPAAGGGTVDRTVIAHQNVISATTQQSTDLTISTLSSPILPSAGVTPFPYLNLSTDSAYKNYNLAVFGKSARVGTGRYSFFETPTNYTTYCAGFIYNIAAGNVDDCYLEVGDSGSPTLAYSIITGRQTHKLPALVGLHYLTGSDATETTPATQNVGYDTFVPKYITEVNDLLSTAGYRLTPSNAATVTLTSSAASSPATLRKGNAATCTFTLANSSSNLTGNIRYVLTFPVGAAPTSITPSDANWVSESSSSTEFVYRRATMAGSSSANLVAVWTALPVTPTLPITITRESDGFTAASQTVTLTLNDSFAGWAAALADPSQAGDPDADGISNLLEYAFGSDPADGTADEKSPQFTVASNSGKLVFPVRSDAAARGVAYSVEYSENLANWSTTAPSGTTQQDSAYAPAVSGFLKREVTFPMNVPRRFARVGILLNE